MDSDKVLKLVEAGFTAAEIRSMLSSSPAQPVESTSLQSLSPEPTEEAFANKKATDTSASSAEAPVTEEPKPDPIAELKTEIGNQIAEAMKAQQESINKIAKLAGMPVMDNVQPKGIEDIVRNFFKEE
ncbi:MAG: hypothetical protein J6W33_01510 [Spirochaetia bacterium]|nr:hypothetical protein [Spirochaetia bacterium]